MKAGDKTRVELPGRQVTGTIIEVKELTKGYKRVKIVYPSYRPLEARCWSSGEVITQYFDNEFAYLEIVLAPKEE